MAVWQFELDPIPAHAAMIDGVPAIHLGADVRDTIPLDLAPDERKQLIEALDSFLPAQQSWSPGLMIWGNTRGTDVQLFLDEDGADGLKIRIDAKTFTFDLVESLCLIALGFGWVFLTERGAVIQPTRDAVLRALLQSPARQFIEDPETIFAQARERLHEPG